MLVTYRALVGPHQPALEEREDTVDTGQQLRRRLFAPFDNGHFVNISFGRDPLIARPAIGVHHTARGN